MRESKMRANYESGGDGSNLPKDVFMYLFSKLEVCSIIRCRSVCKYWLHLLSDPEFVKLHLNNSQTTKKLLFPSDFGSPYILESYDNGHCSNAPRVRHVNLPLEGEGVSYSAKILGSCNGLLCIFMRNNLMVEKDHPHRLHNKKDKYKLLVWNPSTRDYKIILDSNPLLNIYYELFDRHMLVGFGYDSSCDDYKFVQACYSPLYKVETYSLKTNLWKFIEISDARYTNFETCINSTHEGISVNGSLLYWLVLGKEKGDIHIMRYDLEKEKFIELQCLPIDTDGSVITAQLLKVMGGDKLGLSCYYYNRERRNPCIRLWMMKNEGDKEEWSKLLYMSHSDIGTQVGLKSFMFYGPICHFENGNVLFYDTEVRSATDRRLMLIVVDPKLNKIVGRIQVSGIGSSGRFRMETYIETLVSPNALLA